MLKEEIIKKRLENLIYMYVNKRYNFELTFLGIGKTKVNTKEELLSRIDELSQILGIQVEFNNKNNGN